MRIREIANPEDKAEGCCNGLAYNTTTYSRDGCAIHFWVGEVYDKDVLYAALDRARAARDIVAATWSYGAPAGYWTTQDI